MESPLIPIRSSKIGLGQSIPVDTIHAVSVSLPSWKANVGYEEGQTWVVERMTIGYPRFFVNKIIQEFAEAVATKYGRSRERVTLFPSTAVALRCVEFLKGQTTPKDFTEEVIGSENCVSIRIMDLVLKGETNDGVVATSPSTIISAVLFPRSHLKLANTFWQHTGEGISSRRAEFCMKAFSEGLLVPRSQPILESLAGHATHKGPRRYQRLSSIDGKENSLASPGYGFTTLDTQANYENKDYLQFVEERFGRNLDISLAANAKLAIRRRIAESLKANVNLQEALNFPSKSKTLRKVEGLSEDNIYLFPSGMNSIFSVHRTILKSRGSMKSIMFGFPYVDSLKILQKWGPGCQFYGHGSSADLDDLETRCKSGEEFLALFCEFPGNPLLKSPDLRRIRQLADQYHFVVVVDETIGNFLNVHVLPSADIVVSSLTKVFSGDSNVMGGSCILNPISQYYHQLRKSFTEEYEDNYWLEDAIFMERNSRDFITRNDRINVNAESICDLLKTSRFIKQVYYPKCNPSRPIYDEFRTQHGGYGGLLSVTFYIEAQAVAFFDAIDIAKGPSLGTNFTLCSPYVILAHYNELDWVASLGVEPYLIRFSIGLEDTADLCARFQWALDCLEAQP